MLAFNRLKNRLIIYYFNSLSYIYYKIDRYERINKRNFYSQGKKSSWR